jgi:hypothetical protein
MKTTMQRAIPLCLASLAVLIVGLAADACSAPSPCAWLAWPS